MTSFYLFIILLLSVVCQVINTQFSTNSILSDTTTTIEGSETDEILKSSTLVLNTTIIVSTNITIQPDETTSESTVLVSTSFIDQLMTITIDTNSPSNSSPKSRLWFFFIPLIVIIAVIGFAIIHYYRQQSPYRRCTQRWKQCKFRFLQGWRSRDADADDIILQLEQPEIINGQWPPRISFA